MAFQNVNRTSIHSGFVRALRVAFQSNMDFQYRPHPLDPAQPADDSKIVIYDSWPWAQLKYPCIIVSLGTGDPLMRTIGGEHQSDNTSPFMSQDGLTHQSVDAEVFGGGLSTNVNLVVYARSGIERSQIMDWLDIYVRHFFVGAFSREGVSISSMAQGAHGQFKIGNDPVYMDTVTVTVYSEFNRTVPNDAGTIDAICLTNIFSITPDGSTT